LPGQNRNLWVASHALCFESLNPPVRFMVDRCLLADLPSSCKLHSNHSCSEQREKNCDLC
jgi:hypothetical protein